MCYILGPYHLSPSRSEVAILGLRMESWKRHWGAHMGGHLSRVDQELRV